MGEWGQEEDGELARDTKGRGCCCISCKYKMTAC